MKTPGLHHFVIPAILLISLQGCEKNTTPMPDQKVVWVKQDISDNEIGLMNSINIDGHLAVLGPWVFYKNLSIPNGESESFGCGSYEGAGRLKFPVCNNFFIFSNVNQVLVKSAFYDESKSIERVIDLKSFDNEFDNLIDIPYWQGECMGISDSHYLLVSYSANGVNTPRFLLARLVPPINDDNQLEIENIQILDQELFGGVTSVYKIQTFDDHFYIRIGPFTYQINVDGEMKLLSEKWFNIFRNDSVLNAFASDQNGGTIQYYQSRDHGVNWELLGEFEGPNNSILFGLDYVTIDKRIVGYGKGQIFELTINEKNYSLSELDNEGLGLADITSVSMANDSTVFVTSRCNSFSDDCGGFYKPLNDFFARRNN